MTQHDTDSEMSEDQREIAHYFASSRYARTRIQSRQRERMHAASEVGESNSLVLGIGGLTAFVLFFGAAMPVGMELVEKLFSSSLPKFFTMSVVFQTLMYPPIVCFACATVTAMFWYGSVILRFVMAAMAVFPGCVVSSIMISVLQSNANDVWEDIFAVMFPYFLTSATIALGVQLWSPWTMVHACENATVAPPTGMRSMVELTAVAAIGCAVLATIDLSSVLEGVLFFAFFGVLASIAIISVLIFAMGHRRRKATAILITVGIAFLGAAFVNGFLAVAEYGWYSLPTEALLIGAASLYGCVLICVLIGMCVAWLQHCGWTCVNRRTERELRPTLPDPIEKQR